MLFVREMVVRLDRSKPGGPPPIIITLVNPGLCKSNIDRDDKPPGLAMRAMRAVLDRTTEVGGRALVHGAAAAADAHGQFMSDGKNQDVEGWIYEDVGGRAQCKVFEQTVAVLEQRKPNLVAAAGL